jgi:multidrug efflux pump subunit AcrB
MALMLVRGFRRHDAIVMLENIMRHVGGRGKSLRGGAQIGSKSDLHDSSMTVSLIAVFIPVIFMGGASSDGCLHRILDPLPWRCSCRASCR